MNFATHPPSVGVTQNTPNASAPSNASALFNTTIIHGRYNITSIIGKGKFGVVLKACDIITEEPVAIKREARGSQMSSIKHETKIMTYLFQNKFRKLPFVYWYGSQGPWQYLVMTYYDCSLDTFMKSNEFDFELCLENLFSQCICILENIHKLYVLHRDIKPENFMIKAGEVYLIDYGLATFWMGGDGEHIANMRQDMITGTPKYVSYYNYIGNTISRRDDLISLGYMIMYFMYGYLPWQGQNPNYDMKSWQNLSDFLANETTLNDAEKSLISPHRISANGMLSRSISRMNDVEDELYESEASGVFGGIPTKGRYEAKLDENAPSIKITHYMEYCYSLEFDETPNYSVLCGLFTAI